MHAIIAAASSAARRRIVTQLSAHQHCPPPARTATIAFFPTKRYYSVAPPAPANATTATASSSTSCDADDEHEVTAGPTKVAIGRINRRLQITFTCTADLSLPPSAIAATTTATTAPESDVESAEQEEVPCGHRSTHEFSRISYEKGIVLIECPACRNRHLIADNLSWFSDTPSPAHPSGLPLNTAKHHRTVEDLMREKGERVKWLENKEMKSGGVWTLE